MRAGRWSAMLLVLLLTTPAVSGQLDVTYLGNEGFLLRSGPYAVLIDALFGDGLRGYPVVPTEMRETLESSSGMFEEADLVLATHEHGDHFDPRAVARFLQANRSALFVSTPQAVERVRELATSEQLRARLQARLPERFEWLRREGGIELGLVEMHHGTGTDAQNLAFVVRLAGVSVLHVGDTEIDAREVPKLGVPRVDLALLPVWLLGDGGIASWLGARQLGAMHLAVEGAPAGYFGRFRTRQRQIAHLRELHPGVVLFDRPGDTLSVTDRGLAGPGGDLDPEAGR